jgi:hypothetical protein
LVFPQDSIFHPNKERQHSRAPRLLKARGITLLLYRVGKSSSARPFEAVTRATREAVRFCVEIMIVLASKRLFFAPINLGILRVQCMARIQRTPMNGNLSNFEPIFSRAKIEAAFEVSKMLCEPL